MQLMKLLTLFFLLLHTDFLISQLTLKHTILTKNKGETIQVLTNCNSREYPKGIFAYSAGFNISNRIDFGFLRDARKGLLLQIDNFVSEFKSFDVAPVLKVFNSK